MCVFCCCDDDDDDDESMTSSLECQPSEFVNLPGYYLLYVDNVHTCGWTIPTSSVQRVNE